ncbi:DMT family transporter [Anaeromyxobacter diazotrophicus]|uniref:Membrane protein n=1 Tax=Anaeromyxobacter diazotrophicus TaxID=2590199 RepID=A0A7I9VTY5_9BACT|nr:DMT family transporter [Anaeromyxobacter diazotrophicus]GEJ59427.1 membrane protein [Anaeromyxobacter diazotrophicus]
MAGAAKAVAAPAAGSPRPARRTAAVLQVLTAAALWGVNGVVARALFQRAVDPGHLVQVRMLVGGLALVPLALARGVAPGAFAPRRLPALALYALLLAAVQLTYFQAIAAAGVAVAIFLQYTAPLLVAAFEAVRARRLPSPLVAAALATASAGSALLVLPGGGVRVPAAGLAWGLGAAFAFASATVTAGELRRGGLGAIPLLAVGLTLGSLVFVPVRTPWQALASIPPADVPYFLYVALLASALPFTLYAAALAVLPGSVAMLLAMLEPVLAAALAWVALGEALSPLQLAGGALILGAIALAARVK